MHLTHWHAAPHTSGFTVFVYFPGTWDQWERTDRNIKIKLMLTWDGLEVPDKDVDGEEEDDHTYTERLIKVGVTAIFKRKINLGLIPKHHLVFDH